MSTEGRSLRGRTSVENVGGMSWETTDVLSADTTDVSSADTTHVLSADAINLAFSGAWLEMLFCYNLQHMALFGISTSGFCIIFRYANLVFSIPEPIFGTPDSRSGSDSVPAGLGTFFAQKRGGGNMILRWTWSPMRLCGDLFEGFGLYGTQDDFGQAHFSPNPLKNSFTRSFPNPGG